MNYVMFVAVLFSLDNSGKLFNRYNKICGKLDDCFSKCLEDNALKCSYIQKKLYKCRSNILAEGIEAVRKDR